MVSLCTGEQYRTSIYAAREGSPQRSSRSYMVQLDLRRVVIYFGLEPPLSECEDEELELDELELDELALDVAGLEDPPELPPELCEDDPLPPPELLEDEPELPECEEYPTPELPLLEEPPECDPLFPELPPALRVGPASGSWWCLSPPSCFGGFCATGGSFGGCLYGRSGYFS